MIYKTIDDIKAAHERRGGFFFSPSTMRFFGSRILSPVFAGGVFVTSERDTPRVPGPAAWNGERRYTVRVCDSAGDILPASEFGEFATRDAAIAWAKEYAAGVTA